MRHLYENLLMVESFDSPLNRIFKEVLPSNVSNFSSHVHQKKLKTITVLSIFQESYGAIPVLSSMSIQNSHHSNSEKIKSSQERKKVNIDDSGD